MEVTNKCRGIEKGDMAEVGSNFRMQKHWCSSNLKNSRERESAQLLARFIKRGEHLLPRQNTLR